MRTVSFLFISWTLISLIGVTGGGSVQAAGGSTLARPEDPVVLTGADVVPLIGIDPQDLVAFRYDVDWVQIPVQVDERDTKTFASIYNGVIGSPVVETFYTDPNTWTGPDANPTLDANDEVAFMATDAGGQPPAFSQPPGTVGSGVEIAISDPLAPLQTGWAYLFQSAGTLDPGAGASYVSYVFDLASGDYKATYTLGDTHPALAGNPEDSTITTDSYSFHFGDRWQEDELRISVGGATNVDILDRHKPMFAPGVCGRTEDTFNGYVNTSPIEGAFVANKSGSVRAIRSYVGANSGPLTQRDHIFYAQRHDIRTALRVHAIPSILDFFDYSPAASGMMYFNDLNTDGWEIDGEPETPVAGPIEWQMVTGAQGTVVMTASISTNMSGFAYTSYYLDDTTPGGGSETQCTGDAVAYGASGTFVNQPIPCTDPGLGCANRLNVTSTLYYQPPSQTPDVAATLAARASTPLTITATPFAPPQADTDNDGVVDAIDNCPADTNPSQTNSDSGPAPPGGNIGAIGNGVGIGGHDASVPNGDLSGDVCDGDNDNDGLPDVSDIESGMARDLTLDDDGDSVAAAGCYGGLDPDDDGVSWDTDCNGKLDGAPLNCGSATTDSDNDGLLDAWETCHWGTANANADSDADGLRDCIEALDVNGNSAVTNGDATFILQVVFGLIGADWTFDINGNGVITNADGTLIKQAVFNVPPMHVCF